MHMTPMSYIYVLVDPVSLMPRYVGKTSRTLKRRLSDHIQDAKKGGKSHRANWIRQVLARGELPQIEAIECGLWSVDNTNLRERYWIGNLRQLGYKLTNMTDGGDGGAMPMTVEHRAKLGLASKRAWSSEEYRAKALERYADYWRNNDRARAAVARQARERWADPEFATRKTLQSEDYRARRSAIAKKNSSTPEALERLRAQGVKSMLIQRSCNECDYVGRPPHLGTHQKHTGHSGYVQIKGE